MDRILNLLLVSASLVSAQTLPLGNVDGINSGGSLAVSVSGTTATQAILNYTAPSGSACTVQSSLSPTYTPLDYDVDPTLFTGSDQDSRATTVANGLNRSFVLGKRDRAHVATDGNFYSRSLASYSTHYWKITCGANVGSGTLTTQNPPLGNSYSDLLPFSTSAPFGNYAWPTICVDRSDEGLQRPADRNPDQEIHETGRIRLRRRRNRLKRAVERSRSTGTSTRLGPTPPTSPAAFIRHWRAIQGHRTTRSSLPTTMRTSLRTESADPADTSLQT